MTNEMKITFLGRELYQEDIENIKSPVLRETMRSHFSQPRKNSLGKCICVPTRGL